MAESNATQVILTDDGIKIINAQNTADNAASQASKADSAALIAQSKANAAKAAADSTYAYANSEIAVQSTATAKAQSKADDAFNQAQAVDDKASKEIAVQSTATAKAQKAADDAFSKATTAIDNGKVTSQAVTDLKDGSKLTIAELENGLATKVANSDYASYKEQTASQIGQMVTNGAFSAYQQTTADLISSKVANKDFSAYQDTTAKAISSKVESKDFNTYKTQTADTISQTVTNAISNISIGGTNLIANSANTITINGDAEHYRILYFNLTPGTWTFSSSAKYTQGSATSVSVLVYDSGHKNWIIGNTVNIVNGRLTTTFTITDSAAKELLVYAGNNGYVSTVGNMLQLDHYKLEKGNKATDWAPAPEDLATQSQFTQLSGEIEQKVNSGDFSTYKSQTANLIAEKVANKDFSTYKEQTANLISQKVATKDFSSYQATTAKAISSKVESRDFNTYKSQTADAISSKVATKDFSTYKSQTADAINIRVTKKDLIDQINVQAGNTLISSSGQLTLSGKNIYFDTKNPIIIPSANITGTLNGKTINGSTFNAGTKLNQYGNTSYPLTINQDGSVTSTSFGAIANDPAALRTVIKDGSVKTNFRGMKQLSTGIYPAADIALGAGQLALLEGYSTSQDPNFTATGMKTTGFAILDASTGLSLHGTTQSINFSGKDQDQTTGITMDSYGNIIGKPNASWWRITSNSGSNIANFGIDRAGSNVIQFNRELDIGNFHINTGHTFTSADGGAIHFAKGRGGANDIYAGDVHYNSLTKSSLLSVKKDVKKADTAYWAQLVNSIDLATYQYKTDDNTSHLRLSSIVDDVNDTKQWQLPDVFISRDEDGKLCGVDDSVLLNAILATVQEQQKEIDQLNGHNMELEARLNKLEAKLNG